MAKNAQKILKAQESGAITELDMQHGFDWDGQDLAGWIITEKFDGCRAYWDGENMWSRSGICIQIPAEWRAELPHGMHLDGEIYYGKSGRRQCAVAVRYGKFLSGMQFIVFDAPGQPGNYLQRLNAVLRLFRGKSAYIQNVSVSTCRSNAHATERLSWIKEAGGEGIMLRHPEIKYTAGRTSQLLKLKRI